MYTDELTNVMRTALQPVVRFRNFCDAKDATDKGLGKGELFNWNIFSDVAVGGASLDEQEAMPETDKNMLATLLRGPDFWEEKRESS